MGALMESGTAKAPSVLTISSLPRGIMGDEVFRET